MAVPTSKEIAELAKLFGSQDAELCRNQQQANMIRERRSNPGFGFEEIQRNYLSVFQNPMHNRLESATNMAWVNAIGTTNGQQAPYLEPGASHYTTNLPIPYLPFRQGSPSMVHHPPITPHFYPGVPQSTNLEQVAPTTHTLAPRRNYTTKMNNMRRGASLRHGRTPAQARRVRAMNPTSPRMAPGRRPVTKEDPRLPFVCEVPGCGARFGKRDGLTRHSRFHTGERPYPCGVCGQRFTRSDCRKKHQEKCG